MAGLGTVPSGILDYSTNEEIGLEEEDEMFGRVLTLMLVLCVLIVQDLFAVDGVQRWVLAVGANDGGAKRETLQYAVSDAQNFVQVMETMGGIDFAIGRYLMLGASAGYHLIANFAEPIRGRKNFSGPELSISLSLLWGKDVGEVKGIRR